MQFITPKLEELIWQGKATYRTMVHGAGGMYRIPCANTHFIVLLGMTYSPFIDADADLSSAGQYQAFMNDAIHGILLYTTKKEHLISVREWLQISFLTDGVITRGFAAPGQPLNIPLYCIFDEEVRVNINKTGNDATQWQNVDFQPVTDGVNELSWPMHFGTSTQVITAMQIKAGDNLYMPLNAWMAPPPAAADRQVYEFRTRLGQLYNAATLANQWAANFPLITFHYVEILHSVPNEMRPALT
jgi:hypothetical protein